MPAIKQNSLVPAKAAPSLDLPPGVSVKVQIIDSTARIQAPVNAFMVPAISGHEYLHAPAFSFLIEQVSSQRKILFDLALRKDWQNLAPAITNTLGQPGWKLDVEKNVAEILQENGVDVAGGAIEAVIWSHWHFDHTGDISTFPSSTTLITGAGVRDAFYPGYPAKEDAPLLETDFAGRDFKEIDFNVVPTVKIGNFVGYDYFGDGSFYLLDAPGHAIGHMIGLARVTSVQEGDAEDTFIFMGADTAHHGGTFRPSEYTPLPENIQPSPFIKKYPIICPGHIFEKAHPNKKANEPWYHLNDAMPHNKPDAERSIELMQEFDAAENVFVIIAHDDTVLNSGSGVQFFPKATLADWKTRDSANKVKWAFLKDFTPLIK